MPRVRVGSAFGVPIELGASFLLAIPVIAYLVGAQIAATATLLNQLLDAGIDVAALSAGSLPWILGTVAALGLFAGVLLHEFGHSVVAGRYGVPTESITLWFLGGLAHLEEFPDQWSRELAIAVAGPLVSLGLGVVCYLGFVALPAGMAPSRFVLAYLAVLNVTLAGFNLLPGFPMDGGRVLRALLSRNRSRVSATRIAAQVGKAVAVLLGLAGILTFNFFSSSVGLLVAAIAVGLVM
ncbi:MAG: site-2 protease family protein, partial [Haloarculaceae archaeon]